MNRRDAAALRAALADAQRVIDTEGHAYAYGLLVGRIEALTR